MDLLELGHLQIALVESENYYSMTFGHVELMAVRRERGSEGAREREEMSGRICVDLLVKR